MPTVKCAINDAVDRLSGVIESQKLEVELLLCDVLDVSKSQLYLMYHHEIGQEDFVKFSSYVDRRLNYEPLQYITGSVDFFDCKIKCDSRALIPRLETEKLVEIICERHKNLQSILDLGTGTGAIAIALAKYFPQSAVTAVDKSAKSLSLAKENKIANNIINIEFMQSDWFENIYNEYDLIVSNPPYLTKSEWVNSQNEIKNFEPKDALISANDGFEDLQNIILCAKNFLHKNGVLYLETGCDQHPRLMNFAKDIFKNIESQKDLTGKLRFLILSD